jgi:EAL domain-containing protein (putative c-di-GMP-specific phosphodiesterase class I)
VASSASSNAPEGAPGTGQPAPFVRHLPAQTSARRARSRRDIEDVLASGSALAPVFQPIVELATGRVAGYEALSRFRSPTSRTVPVWFAQARRFGLGSQLQAKAIAAALAVSDRPAGRYLSINASPSALISSDVLDELPTRLDDLVVEITEQEQTVEDGPLQAVLAELRSRGARLAVDDTGAGYAGLQRMLAIRPDVIKLDKALVTGLQHDPAKIALVEALVRFARRTGAQICAEGIESAEELLTLADLDVMLGQGHLLGMPADGWSEVPEAALVLCRTSMTQALAGTPASHTFRGDDGDQRMERLSQWLTTVSSRDMLAQVVHPVADMLHADQVVLSRLDALSGRLHTVSPRGWASTGDSYHLADYPLTHHVMEFQQIAQVLRDDPAADPSERAVLRRMGHRSVLLLPVSCREVPLGLLEVYTREDRAWTRTEIRRARMICNQLGPIIAGLSGPLPSS